MTSRTASPLSATSSSPGRIPACEAGEPGATATTRAAVMTGACEPRDRPVPSARMATPQTTVERVLLAEPRGFCAGVEMAIKALAWMVRTFDPPVYCSHELVHNKIVVYRFVEQGVVFVDDIGDVPAGSPIMLSAHGSAPEVV